MSENLIAPAIVAPVLLLDARDAARVCGVSARMWWSLRASGRCPLPVRLGRRTLWRADELADWCKAGCPARDRWESVKKGARP